MLRNTGWMFLGQGLSVVLQAGYFILLARLLGAEQYGIFAGAFALVAIAAPYASMGSGDLFMRYVGADRANLRPFLGNILLSSALVGSGFTLLLYAGAPHLLSPASAALVLLVGFANCTFTQLVNSASTVFRTFDQMKMTAFLSLLVNLVRLLAVALMTLTLHRASAFQWAVASLILSALSACLCMAIVMVKIGRPQFQFGQLLRHAPEGFGYSLGGSAQSVYNDVDKTLLSHYGMNVANGIYTTAYRAVDIATLPITALDAAVLPRFYRESRDGRGVVRLAERLGRRAVAIGLAMSMLLFVCAHLLPYLIGKSFAGSAYAIRWLCLIPALRGWHQLTGGAIASLGFQRYRTGAQFTVAAFNLALNLWLIPRHGWLGAAWASLASDGLLCGLNWALLRRIKERHLAPAQTPQPEGLESITIGSME